MSVKASARAGRLTVDVSITNDKTGHHVPTDSPLRNLILLVSATDEGGRTLRQIEGPTVPSWGGVGDPEKGYYAGLPGKGFAKILQELWTEVAPTGAYWNHTRLLSDNRLAAFATDSSSYTFVAPQGGTLLVDVTLVFRRAFKELADQKKWQDKDYVMASRSIVVPRNRPRPRVIE